MFTNSRILALAVSLCAPQQRRTNAEQRKIKAFPIDMHWMRPHCSDRDASPNTGSGDSGQRRLCLPEWPAAGTRGDSSSETWQVLFFALLLQEATAEPGWKRDKCTGREGGRDRQREATARVFAANGPLWMCVCVCGRMGARVLAPQNDGGLGPGLMRCFRDNARRRVDMWFGRGLYAIFYSLFLITYFSVFFTLPFLSPALHPHHLSAAFSYPQSGGWQWQIEEHRSSTSTRLEGQIITGYFPPPFFFFRKPWLFMWDCKVVEGFHFKMLCVILWITHCAVFATSQTGSIWKSSFFFFLQHIS